ncbi:SusD/RagB family nutrient-binding outer membrane lipoprotein [Albibacterium indicum]|uniref:SusD/RagB family nutrient-binding outer membrane lipoprotein n=1 Tax=Albibacterium indicum TaxID=2292082 RepID=UPI000E4FECED|nr:SusD/RagB family nutrient-binding outer membrane lipoprotein [Pedobacter indicus]
MKKIFLYILPLVLLGSCVKGLDDYNIDQKNPSEVTPGSLFANSTKVISDIITTPNVNNNVFRFWVQQWTATTYQDEPRYDFVTRNIPLNFWNQFYREALMDLKTSKEVAEADEFLDPAIKANQVALTEILSVYAWTVIVNTWGDVPYSEALNLDEFGRPVYDDAATIYQDLFSRLDAAIAAIDPSAEGFGSSDLIYADDLNAWVKFAHSLKIKMAITIADADAAAAQSAFTSSQDKAFASNADNAAFAYQAASPNNNPISNSLVPPFTARQDYVIASTIVNRMNSLEDPRMDFFFKDKIDGKYVGGTPGVTSPFDDFSHVSDKITDPTFEALLLDYSEVLFIKAEAAARGWGGNATTLYQEAITASMQYWGVGSADITAYLARPDVNYSISSANYKERIGNQKWLALYNRGYDAWVEWRRLDYPALSPAQNADGPMPTRLPYLTSEYTLNEANVSAAAGKIDGGDEADGKVFWDKF